MWLLDRPLCAFVGVESVNPGSQACPAVIPDFVLTCADSGPGHRRRRSGLLFIIRGFLAFEADEARDGRTVASPRAFRSLVLTGVGVVAALVIVGLLLPDTGRS